jgi:hypothetical protein
VARYALVAWNFHPQHLTGFAGAQCPLIRGVPLSAVFPLPAVDPTTGKRLTFLTNNLTLAAAEVALLYRKRWRIEVLFKWMKQQVRIKAFFGTSPAAVQTPLWVAVIVTCWCTG